MNKCAASNEQVCFICTKADSDDITYGEWQTVADNTAHQFCLILLAKSKNLSMSDVLQSGKQLMDEFESSKCYICGESYATVMCCHAECSRAYHIVCGEKNHCLFEYIEPFHSKCHEHHGLFGKPKPSWTCQTCTEQFGDEHPIDCIDSCCDQGWYHRQCIRKQAYFSGDNMKCPSCGAMNDERAAFQRFIQTRGVYIPKRSALYPLQCNKKKFLQNRGF